MSKRTPLLSTTHVGEGRFHHEIPVYSMGDQTAEKDTPRIDIVQVVGGPGVNGSAVGYPDLPNAHEHFYSTAIPSESSVRQGGEIVDVNEKRVEIIHDLGFDTLSSIPFGIFSALNSGYRILQPSSFGAATYITGNMYKHSEHAKIDAVVMRSPYFMTPQESLHQVNDPEVVKLSGVRLALLKELIPASALESRQAFMEALSNCYEHAKELGDQRVMAQIALGLVGHQLTVGQALKPDNLPAKLQKAFVNQDWLYKTKKPEKILELIQKLSGADAYLGAELLFHFESHNRALLNGYEDTLEQMYDDRQAIRDAIGSTALGRIIILSGDKDILTPQSLGARSFEKVIGSDVVELRTVRNASHPGYDTHMRAALRSTMNRVVAEVMYNRSV